MSKPWPTVRLGDVLHRTTDTIEPLAESEYREITVRMWGKGVVERGRVQGMELSGRRFVARGGQFITSRIDARNGAMGLVPASLDGALVTNDFPLFNVNTERLEPAFLGWLCRTAAFVELCKRASEGTTNRVRLKEDRFEALEIPLPPIQEQRRIVSRIEELAVQIAAARVLRREAAEEAEALISRTNSFLLDDANWPTSKLGDVLAERPRNGLGPQPDAAEGGRKMLRINAVSSSTTRFVDTTAIKLVQVDDQVASPFVLRHDDVFIVRYNGDLNRVAKPAIYKGENEEKIVYPDKLIRLRHDPQQVIPDFLVVALKSRSVRQQVESLGKTTAGNIGVSGSDASSFIVPVPSLFEQHRIVAELDALQAEVDAVKRLQAETAAELDALLPSILDRALRGEQ